ncbi:MAG TPA: UDP-N-acetylmuramoyl-L-alanyl-D-glutamate--2,6-diaminopimelate ligase [Longimicrobiales bacterium]|nr:UDP-N-acetylmuramoyl-L-alanyl-D-glutamate--2,6-diaminopimelate ligase [Longimicrobiales bacterium]
MSVPRRMMLSELTERLRAAQLLAAEATRDAELLGIADDSRTVQRGDLFCAWSGTAADGHAYVAAAQHAGAVAALVEHVVADAALPQLTVTDGRRAAALVASIFFGEPEHSLRMVGVTGTNGKTTSVWVLRHMLSRREPSASLGTLGTMLEDGTVLSGSEALTTPGPVELARTLRLLVDRGVRAVAMEVSSHALDQGRVHALRFDAALFTNLTRDHLDYHRTFESYRGAKRSLVHLLQPAGCAVVNADDDAWTGLREQAPRTVTFGIAHEADVMARAITLSARGSHFELVTRAGSLPAHLPLLGHFNVENGIGAAAVCISLGFSPAEAAAALATVPQVPGRLERIASSPCAVLRDYAHTPDALENVLTTLRPLTDGRLIVVFGAGGDRDRGKRPLMGAVAGRLADVAIVTSDNPRTEAADAIIDEIEQGMSGPHVRITDRRAAIQHALAMARAQDIVLLAGKGHETYQIIGTERFAFDERVIVQQLLEAAR